MQKIRPYSFTFLYNMWLPLHPFLRYSQFLAEWHWENLYRLGKTCEDSRTEGGGGEKERDCTWGLEARKRLNETRTIQNVTNSTDNCSLGQYSGYVRTYRQKSGLSSHIPRHASETKLINYILLIALPLTEF